MSKYLTNDDIHKLTKHIDENWKQVHEENPAPDVRDKVLIGLIRLNECLKEGQDKIFYQAEHDELYVHRFVEVDITKDDFVYLYSCGIYADLDNDCFRVFT